MSLPSLNFYYYLNFLLRLALINDMQKVIENKDQCIFFRLGNRSWMVDPGAKVWNMWNEDTQPARRLSK